MTFDQTPLCLWYANAPFIFSPSGTFTVQSECGVSTVCSFCGVEFKELSTKQVPTAFFLKMEKRKYSHHFEQILVFFGYLSQHFFPTNNCICYRFLNLFVKILMFATRNTKHCKCEMMDTLIYFTTVILLLHVPHKILLWISNLCSKIYLKGKTKKRFFSSFFTFQKKE